MRKKVLVLLVVAMGMSLVSCGTPENKEASLNKDNNVVLAGDNLNTDENKVETKVENKETSRIENLSVKTNNKVEINKNSNNVNDKAQNNEANTIKEIKSMLEALPYTKSVDGTVEYEEKNPTPAFDNLRNDYYMFYINSGTGDHMVSLESSYAVKKDTKEVFVYRVDGRFMAYKEFEKWNKETLNEINEILNSEQKLLKLDYTKQNKGYVKYNETNKELSKNYYVFNIFTSNGKQLSDMYLVKKGTLEVYVLAQGKEKMSYDAFMKGQEKKEGKVENNKEEENAKAEVKDTKVELKGVMEHKANSEVKVA